MVNRARAMAVLMLLMFCAACAAPAQPSAPEVFTKQQLAEMYQNNTVTVSLGSSHGTGFIVHCTVDESHIVTALHTLAGSGYTETLTTLGNTDLIKVGFYTGKTVTGATVIGFDLLLDTAVIAVAHVPEGVTEINDSKVSNVYLTAQDVLVFGRAATHEAGQAASTAYAGIVSRAQVCIKTESLPTEFRPAVALHAPVPPGASGGPVLSADGTVLGMCFARESDESGLNDSIGYAVPFSLVYEVYKKAAAAPANAPVVRASFRIHSYTGSTEIRLQLYGSGGGSVIDFLKDNAGLQIDAAYQEFPAGTRFARMAGADTNSLFGVLHALTALEVNEAGEGFICTLTYPSGTETFITIV